MDRWLLDRRHREVGGRLPPGELLVDDQAHPSRRPAGPSLALACCPIWALLCVLWKTHSVRSGPDVVGLPTLRCSQGPWAGQLDCRRDGSDDRSGGGGPGRGDRRRHQPDARRGDPRVRRERPQRCLELGFAFGVSTLYIASALEANGFGSLTSVDIPSVHERKPSAWELLDRSALAHRAELVVEETSYNWFLHRTLRERLRDGTIEPVYCCVRAAGCCSTTWTGRSIIAGRTCRRPSASTRMSARSGTSW